MNQTEQPMNLEQPKLTIEQEQEQKLRSKYPNPQKPGGSAFIHKMLHKGSKKYFDSGDYNMAKSKKQGLLNGLNKNGPLVRSVNQTTVVNNSSNQPQEESATAAFNDQAMCDSPMNTNVPANEYSTNVALSTTLPEVTENSSSSLESSLPKPATPPMNQTDSMNTTNNNDTNTCFLNLSSSNTQSPLASSVSSSNLNNQMVIQNTQASQSLGSINSSEKVAQIQINEQQILDSEEIGHGIPTPECLPQSRKHSIVQSKLATPRLSSS